MTDGSSTEIGKILSLVSGSRYTIRGFLVSFGGIGSYDLENK